MRVPNVNSNDFAFAYRYEKIVVFDYTRESKDHINYDLLEDLKNGSIWSPKYQSAVKTWKYNVKVICFSNFPPKYEALSHDRWNVLELRDGKLRRTRAPPTPSSTHPIHRGGHPARHTGRGGRPPHHYPHYHPSERSPWDSTWTTVS
uniref:Master replication protein n=1 Tax=Magallana gigas TaxID=29159 RepID=K1QH53_MAGGI